MIIYNSFILADNQDITRAGLRLFIASTTECPHIVDVACKRELISELERCGEAIIIIDYALFDLHSIDEFPILKARFSRARWLLFSAELSENFLRQVESESNVSIVLKDNCAEEIQSALRYARQGERFLCHQIANFLLTASERESVKTGLTPTEIEILKMIANGLSVKEIAAKRVSSIHTIITHKKNIFRKLDVNNIYEATRYALRIGLIELAEYYI